MIEQPNLFEAKAARDEGMARVLAGPWITRAILAITALPSGWQGTGEAVRLKLLSDGLDPPHHHNAWGGAINHAIARRLLRKTGRSEHMKTKKSHARLTPVYVRLG